MSLTYGSVCSGIEAATVAWHSLGWRAAWFAEIEPFPSAVLAHHYPEVPNLGDMTTIARRVLTGQVIAPDVLVGGTPCQAFSVAGMRESLADARGNLTLRFVELVNAIDFVRRRDGRPPVVVLWENVPGVLSTRDNAFGCFLGGLAGEDDAVVAAGTKWSNAGCVYGPARAIAWRTLDAQYFGLAQRRRRVFVVASARDGFDPAQVLFEWDGVRRDSAPRRAAGQSTAASLAASAGHHGYSSPRGDGSDNLVADVSPTLPSRSRAGGGMGKDFDCDGGLIPSPLAFGGGNTSGSVDVAACLVAKGQKPDFEVETFIAQRSVRRLTPTECERLQGFPDGYTSIEVRGKPAADGPRYKALGNSMATNVMRWIGRRIDRFLVRLQEAA